MGILIVSLKTAESLADTCRSLRTRALPTRGRPAVGPVSGQRFCIKVKPNRTIAGDLGDLIIRGDKYTVTADVAFELAYHRLSAARALTSWIQFNEGTVNVYITAPMNPRPLRPHWHCGGSRLWRPRMWSSH